MRPLTFFRTGNFEVARTARVRGAAAGVVFFAAASFCVAGCGGGSSSVAAPPPPPPIPTSITVVVAPASASALLGNTQTFSATVTNATNNGVSWSVNGVAGGNAAVGTISAAGVYTAPVDLPSGSGGAQPTVQVTATSLADSTKSAAATVTIVSDVALTLTTPGAGVELGAVQNFHAAVASAGHPDTAVRWSVTGASCPAGCGAIDAGGNYSAPGILPVATTVTVTAQSVADPAKQTSTTLTITSNFSLQLTAPASVPAGSSATIVATLTPVPGSNPNQALTWSLSGSGCSGITCGVLTVVTTQSAGGTAVADSATYTAPPAAPTPNSVTIAVTPQADPTKKAQASVAIQPGVGVSLTPSTATLAGNHRVTLTAQVFGAANSGVNWSVNGISGGNASVGQICVVGTSPCQPTSASTSPSSSTFQVDYVAPGAIPTPNPVTVLATSIADSTKSGSAQITVINHLVVTVLPSSVTLAPLGAQTFAATVLGSANQSVVWQVQGTACSVSGACGSVNANGTYTAPSSAPTPDAIQVVAISSDDTTQSGTANVTISSGVNLLALHPASVYAGAAEGFTMRVDGSGFAASVPGPGSVLLIGGVARTTSCSLATECTAPVSAVDVAVAGSVTVQMRNPDGTASNALALVVAAPNISDEIISLTAGANASVGHDIVVVEPTTAGVSVAGDDVDLNVAALGSFSASNNSCTLAGNPVALLRPASGTATADICLFSESGLDASMTYTISGPGDVAVISKQPAGLGIIHLTLQIPATALPGARTLFIQNTNLDKTAASGALEVN